MKKIFLFAIVLLVLGCNKQGKEQTVNIETIINSFDTASVENTTKLPREKVKVDSSLISCNCPEPYIGASIQLKVDYTTDYIKLCSWYYDAVTKEINEFQIFTDDNSLVFEGMPPFEYKLMSADNPLKIRQFTTLPDEKETWQLTPICEIIIEKSNSIFTANYEFISPSPNSTARLNEKSVDSRIAQLFVCAMNEIEECKIDFEAYENKNLDGAIGEMYSELKRLYQQKINNGNKRDK